MNLRDRNPILLGLVAVCALGVGITGTLLWQQEYAPRPVATPTATPSAAAAAPPAPEMPSTTQLDSAQQALSLGNQLYDSGQWDKAIAQYKIVIATGFDNPDVRTDMGNALRFSGKPKEALEQYKIAQNQDPTHEQSLFNQGGLWAIALKNPAKGVEAWKAYLQRFPKGGSAQDARNFIKKYQGK